MKTNLLTVEDTIFLNSSRLATTLSDVVTATPARFNSSSIEEIGFPVRFVARMKAERITNLGQLRRVNLDALQGKNLGLRTIEVAKESLSKFIVKKIHQQPLNTLRDMMTDFGSDLLAREARIWEMRTGINGESFTLDYIGTKYGLTRERVRQIESVLINQFAKKYPAIKEIAGHVKDGMKLADLIAQTGKLLESTDPLPLSFVLESLDQRMYLVNVGNEQVISVRPRTALNTTFTQTLSIAEKIFRNSETLMSRPEFVAALNATDVDAIAKRMAISALDTDGIWVDGVLVSPNNDKLNVAIGCLQASPHPVALDVLCEDVYEMCQERVTPEGLRSSFSFVPAVRSFGHSMVGFARHVHLTASKIAEAIEFCEGVIQRGPEAFQWSVKELQSRMSVHRPNIVVTHYELNVILHDAIKLVYLGRQTWMLKGEHETQRKFYRDILENVLTSAGRPMREERVLSLASKQRVIEFNSQLRNDAAFLEVRPKIWGLTKRDNPFGVSEVKRFAKLFDEAFERDFDNAYLDEAGVNRRGMNANEIMKVVELLD